MFYWWCIAKHSALPNSFFNSLLSFLASVCWWNFLARPRFLSSFGWCNKTRNCSSLKSPGECFLVSLPWRWHSRAVQYVMAGMPQARRRCPAAQWLFPAPRTAVCSAARHQGEAGVITTMFMCQAESIIALTEERKKRAHVVNLSSLRLVCEYERVSASWWF